MAEQIKFGDRLFLVGEKVILDSKVGSPILESRNGTLVIGNQRDEGTENEHLVIIKGNLQVDGTMTTVNTETIALADPFILLNGDLEVTDTPEDAGIEINRGSESNKKFGWDETNDRWTTYDESLNIGNLFAEDATLNNISLTGSITSPNNQVNIGNFTFTDNVISVITQQMEIRSPGGISLYPDSDNSDPVEQGGEKIVWLRDGAKLVFEGTVPDDYEVKLQATDITADRDIILPDESGTLALQEWTTRQIDALTTDDIAENNVNLYYTDDRVQTKLGNVSGHILPDTDITYDIGSPTQQFRSLYLSEQTIYMGGVELRVDGETNNFNITSIDGDTIVTEAFATESYTQAYVTQALADAVLDGSIDLAGYATQTYVDAKVANIVDSAPNTLDTLNELSAALNNDSDFANNVTASIANKVSISDLSAVATTGSYNDLTDQPTIIENPASTADLETVAFSGLYNDLLLKPTLFSGSWDDLTDKPPMFSGSYLQLTDTPTLFDGQYSSLVGNPSNVSEFINDSGYVKHSAESHIVPTSDNLYDLGSTTKHWSTIYGHTVEATYADLAERYASDMLYDEGTVLIFGGDAEVTTTSQSVDVRVAGIVSINPGLKLNSDAGNSDTHPYIALKGRVPCKVIGPVRKGDLLVTSATPGFAKSVGQLDHGHAVLGKSLETNLSDGEKLIEVFAV